APVRSKEGGFARSFLMSRPPLLAVMQGGESPASPFFVVERAPKNCFVVQSLSSRPLLGKGGDFASLKKLREKNTNLRSCSDFCDKHFQHQHQPISSGGIVMDCKDLEKMTVV